VLVASTVIRIEAAGMNNSYTTAT